MTGALTIAGGLAVLAAIACGLVGLLAVGGAIVDRRQGGDAAPAVGCALLGLVWALIALGLLALAKP